MSPHAGELHNDFFSPRPGGDKRQLKRMGGLYTLSEGMLSTRVAGSQRRSSLAQCLRAASRLRRAHSATLLQLGSSLPCRHVTVVPCPHAMSAQQRRSSVLQGWAVNGLPVRAGRGVCQWTSGLEGRAAGRHAARAAVRRSAVYVPCLAARCASPRLALTAQQTHNVVAKKPPCLI